MKETGHADELFVEDKLEDSLTGTKHLHFWSAKENSIEFTAEQTAAESVMSDVDEHVRAEDCIFRWLSVSGPWPVASAYSSAIIRCGVDIPSPRNMNTYFGAAASAVVSAPTAIANAATRPKAAYLMFCIYCVSVLSFDV